MNRHLLGKAILHPCRGKSTTCLVVRVSVYNISDIGLKLTDFIFSCYGFHNMEPVNSACTCRSIAFEYDCKSIVPHTFPSLEEIFVGACECQMQLIMQHYKFCGLSLLHNTIVIITWWMVCMVVQMPMNKSLLEKESSW